MSKPAPTRSALFERVTSPAVLNQIGIVSEAIWTAWSLRRRPRTSGQVFRRALVSGALGQGAALAATAAGGKAVSSATLIEPIDAYRGPVGDVPVRIATDWDADPVLTTAHGRLVVVAGPHYERLSGTEQETQYRRAVEHHLDPMIGLGLVAATASLNYGLSRLFVGGRPKVSRARSAMLGAALALGGAGLTAASRQVNTRRRQTRVAAERR